MTRVILAALFAAFTCTLLLAADKPAPLPTAIIGSWRHSHEEDADGVKVYRTSDYRFPPARGRAGFEIKKGGAFIDHPIAPADGNESVKGTWKLEGGKVTVTFADNDR